MTAELRNLPHIASMAFNEPLMLEPAYARVFFCALAGQLGISRLTDAVSGDSLTAGEAPAALALSGDDDGPRQARSYQVMNGIAVLPVSGTLVTVTISDDHNFDRQIIIPPIIFNGIAYDDPGSGNNPGGTRYTGYGFEVRKNGVLIASRETKGAIPGSYSAVIDMPSGGGSVTLEFKIFQKGNQGAGNITDCTVIVTKKAASGISIR
ncbi:phage tail tip protein [Escherichia coli]